MDVLGQYAWWLAGLDPSSIGFDERGLLTRLRMRRHRTSRRRFHVGLLTGGTRFPNIVDLHLFWLNERCPNVRFSRDGVGGEADMLWVYSQDPLTAAASQDIAERIAAARRGIRVVNAPAAYDFFHREDSFERLERAAVPVPKWRFGPEDEGRPVMWKATGRQSSTIGPEPYDGERPGWQPLEFIDTRGADGLHGRYRVFFLLGEIFLASAFRSRSPIVRYKNAVKIDRTWQAGEDLYAPVRALATVSGLDFFAADFVRRGDRGPPVFTDVNVFPMLKDKRSPAVRRGRGHDFDALRPATTPETPWQVVERTVAEASR